MNLNEEKIINNDLNQKINELKNILNNKEKTNDILDLKNEIKLFRSYYNFSPEEKLISIKLISVNQDIDFKVIAKNTDYFSKLENILYQNYPKYKYTQNYLIVSGNVIQKNKTLEDNKIKNNDVLTLEINNFD